MVKNLLISFAAVTVGAFLLLYFLVTGIVGANRDSAIDRDMRVLLNSCTAYMQRYLDGCTEPEREFALGAAVLAESLGKVFGRRVGIYGQDGAQLASNIAYDTSDEDITMARKGISAYTLVTGEVSRAYFSFPIVYEETQLGVVRMETDYTKLFEEGAYMVRMVLLGGGCVLCAALILLVLIMRNVIRPVKRLSAAIGRVSSSPDQAEMIPVSRRDEIGELTERYNHMIAIIKEQWHTIQFETENLRNTIKYRREFYANITHELKTPLTIILGYAEMIEQTEFQDEAFNKKGIGEIIRETKRLCDMVVGLLEASRATGEMEQELKNVDIQALVMELTESMRIKARRYGSSIEADVQGGVFLRGDAEKLRQMLVNLMDSAIKYGKPGEPVRVQGVVRVDTYVLSVENRMEREQAELGELRKLFLPFYRSRDVREREAGSVGLGLAICRNIAEAHGGSIRAELPEDGLIRFIVRIPVVPVEREADI